VVFQELARAASIAEDRLKQGHSLNLRREAVVSTYPLGYLGVHPPSFWFDIYKALECLMHRSGGETAFIALDWAPRDDVKLLKQTANWARHARRKYPEPSPATTEQEAKDLMSRLLRKAFETAATP
jgi:hypothetical protein